MTNRQSHQPSSVDLEKSLSGAGIHDGWIRAYRSGANVAFYEEAFDRICEIIGAPDGSVILDVGCGTCQHSVRLVRRGFRLMAVDFSRSALERAEAYVAAEGCRDSIALVRGSALALPYEGETFRYVLCWGVLMHIKEIEIAVSELSRVAAPGGLIVVSEGNMHSIQAILIRSIKSLLKVGRSRVVDAESGVEFMEQTSEGPFLTRQANIPWLVERFDRHGCDLVGRLSGQFSELYAVVRSESLRRLNHAFNRFYFRHLAKYPGPAFANILILRKRNTP